MTAQSQAARDPEGYLVDPQEWDEVVACELAAEEGIELDETCWSVLRFMREAWSKNRIAPDVRHVVDFLATSLGIEKRMAKTQLFRMFPYGYVKQTCKIAGMQRPRVWSTG